MFELFKDLKKLMTDLSEEVNTMKINLERVQEESIKAERVGQDIQKKEREKGRGLSKNRALVIWGRIPYNTDRGK